MWRRISEGLAVASLFCGILCYAQSTNSGDIRGTVTDQSGAVIPGVTVTVQDVDKQVTRTFTTDGAGLFDTGSIVPDHYLLTFTKPGFETLVRGPLTLVVGIQGLNVQLAVGKAEQKIVVNTNVPLLNTESGAQEDTLVAGTMDQLPQAGIGAVADWENFIWLQPGAAGTPENASSAVAPNGGQVSVNGNLPYETYLADGATTTLPMSQNSNVTIFETTSEVEISNNAFSAQYGIGNTVYNQITKGGSEQFHGEGYEYFQNNAMDAVPYDFGGNAKVPVLRFNNFGFNVGGPVLRHRMFFFFDYDKTIDNGGAAIGFETVPNSALEGGDFTGAGLPTLYDPTTQTLQQTGTYTYTTPVGPYTQTCPCVIRKTFLSEYGTNAIPSSMIDAVAKKVQAYYPSSNTPGQVTSGIAENNFTYNTPSTNPYIKYFGRLDWDITPSNRLTISETDTDNPATYLNQGICPINCQSGDVSNDNAQVSDVWTFSPNLINEVRLGFTDQLNFFQPYTLNQGYPGKLGWQFAKADNFPNVSINDFYELGSQSNAVYKEFVFDPSDVVSLIHGRHVLHFGGEFLINRADSTAWGNINAGTVNYNGDYTSMNGQTAVTLPSKQTYSSGMGYADFLLGQTQSWSAQVTPEFGGRWKSPQLFVQDDFKMRPNLTLNLGLRYEIETGWSEVKGNEAAFDPTVTNPANGSLGAMWYGFSHANGRTTLQAPKYDIILPRVGFSWEMMPRTVLRGGFGVYAASWSEDTYGAGMGNAFGSNGNYGDTTNGLCPIVQLSGDGTTPDTTDPGCGVGSFDSTSLNSKYITSPTTPDALNGTNVSYNEYHTPVPRNYQWSLAMQRQFGPNYVVELTYVGNHGSDLNLGTDLDINQVPEDKLGPNDLSDEPYPLFQQIEGSTNNGVSNYNALEGVLTKRVSQGLEFSANYTWSHFLDDQDSSGWGSRGGWQNYQNAYDPGANYSNSNYDIRNMLKGYAVYDLPVGKGRMFLNNNTAVDEVIGGWQLAGTFVVQGGNPISITTGNNNSSNNQSGSYTQFANLVGNYKLSGSTKSRLNEWYNLSALAVPAPYTYGDFRRNIVYGPGLSDVNGQLSKNFNLWPERGVQLHIEGEAFNVLNHPSFGQPGNNAIGPGESAQITGVTVGGRTLMLYGKISF